MLCYKKYTGCKRNSISIKQVFEFMIFCSILRVDLRIYRKVVFTNDGQKYGVEFTRKQICLYDYRTS